jgi:hypothetical protein
MKKQLNRPPAGQSWIWLTKEMMKGTAWRSLGPNAKRVVEFLMVEWMDHGGRQNGRLVAPYRHLEQIGISVRLIADAIREAEAVGLIDCFRGGMRVATTYALTWLPLHDETPPSNRWRSFQNPRVKPWPERKQKEGKHHAR